MLLFQTQEADKDEDEDRWKRRVSKDINPILLIFNKHDWNLQYLKVKISHIASITYLLHKVQSIFAFGGGGAEWVSVLALKLTKDIKGQFFL